MFNRENGEGGTVVISFLIGSIVGAGIALLFAPYSGKKTRGKIADLADDARDYATDYAKKIRHKIS
jgi:gas vesicle protein